MGEDLLPQRFIGRHVGEYELRKLIGQGSFALVFAARHVVTNSKLAVKVILRSSLDSGDAAKRFEREVSFLRQLRHPFIAELFEVLDDAEAFYLIMEYASGGNLLEYVNKNGRLAEAKARRFFCELMSALDYLHNVHCIAHRDLKVENILLDRHDNVRLIDFGLSNEFRNQTMATSCGSPAYIAPELLRGGGYTKACDIWSSGVVLYAIIAGRLPFEHHEVPKLLRMIATEEVVYPPFMSRSLVDFLRRLLTKDPDERVTIDRLREHPWFSQCEYASLTTWNVQFLFQGPDRGIIEEMSDRWGLDVSGLAQAVMEGQWTPMTAVYRMLRRDVLCEKMKGLLTQRACDWAQPQLRAGLGLGGAGTVPYVPVARIRGGAYPVPSAVTRLGGYPVPVPTAESRALPPPASSAVRRCRIQLRPRPTSGATLSSSEQSDGGAIGRTISFESPA